MCRVFLVFEMLDISEKSPPQFLRNQGGVLKLFVLSVFFFSATVFVTLKSFLFQLIVMYVTVRK